MNIIKIAAFADGDTGGNPAGVVLNNKMPNTEDMQRIAAEIGFSETVFAEMQSDQNSWRVRYFSPESEVPFCGHATIALGAELAKNYGDRQYQLILNEADITVTGNKDKDGYTAALQSPPTHYQLLNTQQINATLALFAYKQDQLSDRLSAARIHAGANHYVFALKSMRDLASMTYDLDEGRRFMRNNSLVTIMFVVVESDELFHARNAFASGGVLEDPATGAAAAAFSAYLRDSAWTNKNKLTIIQGADMGSRSIIKAEYSNEPGSSVRISGATRVLD